jgi:hypothetical protein
MNLFRGRTQERPSNQLQLTQQAAGFEALALQLARPREHAGLRALQDANR